MKPDGGNSICSWKFAQRQMKIRKKSSIFKCEKEGFTPLKTSGNYMYHVALGGLVVSVLATGPKVAGSNPAEDDGFKG
jgi:hypothetical protein